MAKKSLTMYDNDTLKWTHDGKRYCLHIQTDDYPESPRNWDGHLCTLACWHRSYSLGDNIGKAEPKEYFRSLVRANVPEQEVIDAALNGRIQGIRSVKTGNGLYDIYEEYYLRTPLGNSESSETLEYEGVSQDSVADYIIEDLTVRQAVRLLEPYAEIVQLWLYDHSGITMSCGNGNPFSCGWDSGCVGFAIALKDEMIKNAVDFVLDENGERVLEEHKHENAPSTYSYKTKPLTEETWRSVANDIIHNEVAVYDTYLRGDVYGFKLYEADIEEEEPEWEEVDSCWGFYGNDIVESGMTDYVGNGITEVIESGEYETGEAVLHTSSYYEF